MSEAANQNPLYGVKATCEAVDGLPPAVRALVHEFGFSSVAQCYMAGVRSPKMIRHLIYAIWRGSSEPGNHAARSINGVPTLRVLEDQLAAGRINSVRALVQFLDHHSYTIVPTSPTKEMIEASIAETGKLGLVSKTEKHTARLTAALRAYAAKLAGRAP